MPRTNRTTLKSSFQEHQSNQLSNSNSNVSLSNQIEIILLVIRKSTDLLNHSDVTTLSTRSLYIYIYVNLKPPHHHEEHYSEKKPTNFRKCTVKKKSFAVINFNLFDRDDTIEISMEREGSSDRMAAVKYPLSVTLSLCPSPTHSWALSVSAVGTMAAACFQCDQINLWCKLNLNKFFHFFFFRLLNKFDNWKARRLYRNRATATKPIKYRSEHTQLKIKSQNKSITTNKVG